METVATSAEHVRGLGLALEKERGASLEEKEAAYRARAALLEVPVVYVLVGGGWCGCHQCVECMPEGGGYVGVGAGGCDIETEAQLCVLHVLCHGSVEHGRVERMAQGKGRG